MSFQGYAPSGTVFGDGQWQHFAGDASGVVQAIKVIGLRGREISELPPSEGDVYIYQSGQWTPGAGNLGGTSGLIPHNLLSSYHSDTLPGSPIEGDLVHASGIPPVWSRLGKGLIGQYLNINASGQLTWTYGNSSILNPSPTSFLNNMSSKVIIMGSGARNVWLPGNPIPLQEIMVKDGQGTAQLGNITVWASGGLIDGMSNVKLLNAWQSYSFLYNGTDWNIV